MPDYTASVGKHATTTLSGTPTPTNPVVDRVTLTLHRGHLTVVNSDPALLLYFRVDGIDPTIEGDNTIVVQPSGKQIVWVPLNQPATVRLISSGTCKYAVMAVGG